MRLIGFARKEAPSDKKGAFWAWFAANEARFRDLRAADDRTVNEIGTMVRAVCPDLTFEVGPGVHSEWSFVVSADGIRSAFPAVVDLVNAAPSIPGWDIVAFRQPRQGSGLNWKGAYFATNSFYYTSAEADGELDLVIYCPGLNADSEETLKGVTFLLLDFLLGEFDVATRIGAIDWVPLEAGDRDPRLRPLTELRAEMASRAMT